MGRDLVQKLREEKESQEAQYEEEFREFERMANEKVVQLEEYYVQQLQMKEVHVQSLQQQLQQSESAAAIQQPNSNQQQQWQSGTEELKKELIASKEMCVKLSGENNKLSADLSNLKYQQ